MSRRRREWAGKELCTEGGGRWFGDVNWLGVQMKRQILYVERGEICSAVMSQPRRQSSHFSTRPHHENPNVQVRNMEKM